MAHTYTTADGATVRTGDRVYNYYSMCPGVVGKDKGDGWFFFEAEPTGGELLNGDRICTLAHAERMGWSQVATYTRGDTVTVKVRGMHREGEVTRVSSNGLCVYVDIGGGVRPEIVVCEPEILTPTTETREKQMALPYEDCLEFGPDCGGHVEYRMALSGTGKSFPRCDEHWSKRLAEQERINRDYPDSPVAPAWFDPAAAGERWDDDY